LFWRARAAGLAERVTGVCIDREERLDMTPPGPSDHAPVVVVLR